MALNTHLMLQGQQCVEREALEKQVYSDVSYDVFNRNIYFWRIDLLHTK